MIFDVRRNDMLCKMIRAAELCIGDVIDTSSGVWTLSGVGGENGLVEAGMESRSGVERSVSYKPDEMVRLCHRPWPEGRTEAEVLRPVLAHLGIMGPFPEAEGDHYCMLNGRRGDINDLRDGLRELYGRIGDYLLGLPLDGTGGTS
jgi:hypothetical protein